MSLLEQILEARFEFAYAPRQTKHACRKRLFDLVDKAIEGKNISRYELLHAIHDRYLAYKKERRKKERVSISQRLRTQ
jgi:hypothetical protein